MELRKNLAISDTGFVFDATAGESYSLNPIGLEILNYLKEGLTDEEIKKVEDLVNEQINKGLEVYSEKHPKEEALKMVLATFIAFVTQEDEHDHDHNCEC